MSDPSPPEATSPPAPPRVQFTMRTFFVAALWISAVFAAGKSFPPQAAVVCIALLVVIGFYGVYHILQANCAKIAIPLGTLTMLAGCAPLPFLDVHTIGDPLSLVFVVVVGWGVLFSIIVGVTRAAVLRVRRTKKKPWYCFWQRYTAWDEEPRSEAATMATALAGFHFRWSSYILIAWVVVTICSGSSSVGVRLPLVILELAPLDAPFVPLLCLMPVDFGRSVFAEPTGVVLWITSNVFGVPLYLGLGWLIGRTLDYSKNAKHISGDSASRTPSSDTEPVEEMTPTTTDPPSA